MQTSTLTNQGSNILDYKPIFTQNGYLPPGFHNINLNVMKYHLVDCFPNSTTRNIIFSGYIQYCVYLQYYCGVYNFIHRIGGSFCTVKNNPNDIDVVTYIDDFELNKLNGKQYTNLCMPQEIIKSAFHCDIYYIIPCSKWSQRYNEYQRDKVYWRGLLGYDRLDNPKGTLQVTFGQGIQYY